jgi:hypothetical protein
MAQLTSNELFAKASKLLTVALCMYRQQPRNQLILLAQNAVWHLL